MNVQNQNTGLSFEVWMVTVPDVVKKGPIWQSLTYPKALYLYDMAWQDCQVLWKAPLGRPLADQLIRSVGSISANLEEGFGRGVQSKTYDQFLRYSLGSAREAEGWYYRSRQILSTDLMDLRLSLLEEIISLLVSTLKRRQTAPTSNS
jgi:four helix bundle protein